MAPDAWHHLEGTYPEDGTFRVHLYDNFSQPLSAKAFKGRAVLKESFDPVTPGDARAPRVSASSRRGRELSRGESPERIAPDRDRGQDPVRERRSVRAVRLRVPGLVARVATVPTGGDGARRAARSPKAIAAAIVERARRVKDLLARGAFTEIYVPALEAKELALALEARRPDRPGSRLAHVGSQGAGPRRVASRRLRRSRETRRSFCRARTLRGSDCDHRIVVRGTDEGRGPLGGVRSRRRGAPPRGPQADEDAVHLPQGRLSDLRSATAGPATGRAASRPCRSFDYKDTFPWAVSIKNQVLVPFHAALVRRRALRIVPAFFVAYGDRGRHHRRLVSRRRSRGRAGRRVRSTGTARRTESDMVLEIPEAFVLEAAVAEALHEALLETGTSARADSAIGRVSAGAAERRSLGALLRRPEGEEGRSPRGFLDRRRRSRESGPKARECGVPANASLLVRIHYKKTWLDEGKEIRDRSEVALSFAAKGRPIESVVVGASAVYSLTRDVEVLSVLPSIDAGVESLQAEAVLPDGTTRPLIGLRAPDPAWPRTYWLEEPIQLPKGSRLRVRRPHPTLPTPP